jgi:hypothetical protein
MLLNINFYSFGTAAQQWLYLLIHKVSRSQTMMQQSAELLWMSEQLTA